MHTMIIRAPTGPPAGSYCLSASDLLPGFCDARRDKASADGLMRNLLRKCRK